MRRALLVSVAILLLSPALFAEDDQGNHGRPADFAVRYGWSTGTVAPQYRRSTTIDIHPDGTTFISVERGYGGDAKHATIHLTARDLDRLYRTLALRGAFNPREKPKPIDPRRNVGGGSRGITITANGKTITLIDSQFTDPVYDTIPPKVWKKLQ